MNSIVLSSANSRGDSSENNTADPVVCFTNIGPQEQRKRLRFGIVAFVFGIALAALLIAASAPMWTRLILFAPFASAGIGYFQVRDKT